MAKGSLSPQIAAQIVDHIRAQNFKRGQHLPSQSLADTLRVSRAPVNAALRVLEGLRIVRAEPNRGFFLQKDADQIREVKLPHGPVDEEEVYSAIADDRLSQKLPDRVSESELMRMYQLPRGRLLKILHRIAEEGWIQRRPSQGWEFRPVLTSRKSYEEAYRFRSAIEVSAVLEPTFRVDKTAFDAARAQQIALLDGDLMRLSRSRLFQINSEFHEMIVECSHNEFFLEAIKRVNRLRRLIEYHATLDRSRLQRQCQEHLEILDRLESGDLPSAAAYLKIHIEGARKIKAGTIG
jgi:DNA-binding GntR family transcriptional regulator